MITKTQLFESILNETGTRVGFFDNRLDDVDPSELDSNGFIDSDVLSDKYPDKISHQYGLARFKQDELDRVARIYPDGFDKKAYHRFLYDGIALGRALTQAQIKSKQAYWMKAHNMSNVEMYKFVHQR